MLKGPKSVKSGKEGKSESTTKQTGELYFNGIRDGFLAQNNDIMRNNCWMFENLVMVDMESKQQLGDFDLVCEITVDTTLQKLFTTGSQCTVMDIPAGTFLLIEVTSMSGDLAITKLDKKTKQTKVALKRQFYGNVLGPKRADAVRTLPGVNFSNAIVIFVYDGADYVDVSREFCFGAFYKGAVVHFPMEFALNWPYKIAKDAEIAEKDNEITAKNAEIAAKDAAIAAKDAEIAALNAFIAKFPKVAMDFDEKQPET